MATAVKMNISFAPEVAQAMRRRAREQAKPVSRYLANLVDQDLRAAAELLANEGYRELGADTLAFAEDALPLAGIRQLRAGLTVDQRRLADRIGQLDAPRMLQVDAALRIQFGL